MNREGVFQTFFQTSGSARIQSHQFSEETQQRSSGIDILARPVSTEQLLPDVRLVLLGEVIDHVSDLVDLTTLDEPCLPSGPPDRGRERLATI